MKFHCFFEQSGTFKNEFKKLGYEAYDYDIKNDFGETDYVLDLFQEIENGFSGKASVFENISQSDLIFAFFPCVRFVEHTRMNMQGNGYAQQKWSDYKKLEFSLKTNEELNYMYGMITKLAMICLKRKIPLIIENPYQYDHYLTNYWPLKSSFIDTDRHKNGDYFKKPTQYWFIGLEPENNLPGDAIAVYKKRSIKGITKNRKLERSMISPEYAKRFIKTYIVNAERGAYD